MDIRASANKLALKYKTRDPFQIAEALGCIIIRAPLKGLRGFYRYAKRCHIIYISDFLDDFQSKLVCAHELGHIVLHRGLNRVFMDSCTNMVSNKYELEANRFAVELIISDDMLSDYADCTISQLSQAWGIDQRLIAYRLNK